MRALANIGLVCSGLALLSALVLVVAADGERLWVAGALCLAAYLVGTRCTDWLDAHED